MSRKRRIEAAAAEQEALSPQELEERRREKRKISVFGSPVRNLFLTAVISFLVGAAFFFRPVMVYTYSGFGIGGILAFFGLIFIIIYFGRKPVSGVYHSEFAIGVVLLALGVYVALGGYISKDLAFNLKFATIVRLIGVVIVADGLMKLQYALDLARMDYPKWWVALLASILGIAIGVVVALGIGYAMGIRFSISQTEFSSGMMALGLGFALNGLIDLIAMFTVAARNRKARREAEIQQAAEDLLARRKAAAAAAAPVAVAPVAAAPVVAVPAPDTSSSAVVPEVPETKT